ncbi:MAG: potassium channel family protein [Gammaproteobacteria bacterium]|nr:potassium channel family protein [Gammaproteobacteria bacterium]
MATWSAHAWIVAATLAAVAVTVAMHYEGLIWLARRFGGRRKPLGRRSVLLVIAGLLVLHVAEIFLFGAAYWGLLRIPGSGGITGADPLQLYDAVYLSAITYTTVGFGDLAPVGPIRFLAGTEALIGLMMITWSASFTYLEMSRHWRER